MNVLTMVEMARALEVPPRTLAWRLNRAGIRPAAKIGRASVFVPEQMQDVVAALKGWTRKVKREVQNERS